MSPSFPVEHEAFRVALIGVAHLARHADLAAAFYRQRTHEPKRFTPRRRFVLKLCRAYQDAFGKRPTRSTNHTLKTYGGRRSASGPRSRNDY